MPEHELTHGQQAPVLGRREGALAFGQMLLVDPLDGRLGEAVPKAEMLATFVANVSLLVSVDLQPGLLGEPPFHLAAPWQPLLLGRCEHEQDVVAPELLVPFAASAVSDVAEQLCSLEHALAEGVQAVEGLLAHTERHQSPIGEGHVQGQLRLRPGGLPGAVEGDGRLMAVALVAR